MPYFNNFIPNHSDEIINEIVAQRLSESDCNKGFILDGYPRTIAQKDFFSNYLDFSSGLLIVLKNGVKYKENH